MAAHGSSLINPRAAAARPAGVAADAADGGAHKRAVCYPWIKRSKQVDLPGFEIGISVLSAFSDIHKWHDNYQPMLVVEATILGIEKGRELIEADGEITDPNTEKD